MSTLLILLMLLTRAANNPSVFKIAEKAPTRAPKHRYRKWTSWDADARNRWL